MLTDFPIVKILELLLMVTVLAVVARRLHFPLPILLVLVGMAVGFIPGFPQVTLHPKLIFLLFLPPLLYINAWFTSIRELRSNTRVMFQLAIGLVLASTFVVGIVAHQFVDGLSLASAFLLGAIISPPDAVAATAIIKDLNVPRRIVTVLEGESLLNDATALVAYSFAVTAVMTNSFSWGEAGLNFLKVGLGGIAYGTAAGWAIGQIRDRLNDPPVEITISLLTPFAAYLPAESMGVSGVLATVSAGLYLGSKSPLMMSSNTRIQATAIWEMIIFLLNGLIFLLTGLQLPMILRGLSQYSPMSLVGYALLISATVIVVRIVWVYALTYGSRFLFKSLRKRDPYPPWQHIFVVAWSGMRGVVSLAAAMALPVITLSGVPFPHRDLIIFLTFSVIIATLVFQGLTLPKIVSWLGVVDDYCFTCDEMEARVRAAYGALKKLDEVDNTGKTPLTEEVINHIRADYKTRIRDYYGEASLNGKNDENKEALLKLQRELLMAERNIIIDLRNEGVITDEVLRKVEHDLDLQELRVYGGAIL